ncbi:MULTISPECIES: hypothetical protein [Protofrankia]|uniref:Uncharacterized protein n=1 Tax=Candidatus Protofrankia datiscae TaxID=2716812 RepID=F8B524_9ACTN|nr:MULTISPECIES: hypothetical protein [Protofrankia]AEH11046.1 hypothetical protein FsymDg_3769 [Candidatus Protofrankia datiscae]
MVALRSRREDRVLLVAAWVLTVIALVLGVVASAPILILWGVLGVGAAVFATRIHLRDTRVHQPRPGTETQLAGDTRPTGQARPAGQEQPAGQPRPAAGQAPAAGAARRPAGADHGPTSVQTDAVEQEHVR